MAETRIVVVRASSFGTLLDCAHRWEGEQVMGLRTKPKARTQLGTALHASTAVFDNSRMKGNDLTADDTAGVFVDQLRYPDDPVDWTDENPDKLEKIGLDLHGQYCNTISPKYEFRAVEMNVGALDVEVGGIIMRLTGTMDRSRVRKGAGLGVNDLKTGKRAVTKGRASTKGHAAQLGIYELVTEKSLHEPVTEPARIVGLQTSGNPHIGEADINGARGQLIGNDKEPGLLEMGAMYLKTGLFPPNPRSMLCGEKYCGRWSVCRFRDQQPSNEEE